MRVAVFWAAPLVLPARRFYSQIYQTGRLSGELVEWIREHEVKSTELFTLQAEVF